MLKAGDTVVVTVNGEPLGLMLEEFWPFEPSAYVWDPFWLAYPVGEFATWPTEDIWHSGYTYSLHESGRVERVLTDHAGSATEKPELVGDHDLADPEYGGM